MTWVPKDFLPGLKTSWSGIGPLSFFPPCILSNIFPLGFNIYKDSDHLYMMTLKYFTHDILMRSDISMFVTYFHLAILI